MGRARTFELYTFPFPTSPFYSVDTVKAAVDLRPQSRDVFICSFPTCDSKIVEAITWKLLFPGVPLPRLIFNTNRYLPILESSGLPENMKKRSPRLLKTHLPIQMTPYHKKAKYIYVIRNPWDVCTSYFRFLWLINNYRGTFDEFVKLFLENKLGYGSYIRHLTSWKRRIDMSNVLFLVHEHVKKNPQAALSQIASFLGDPYLTQYLTKRNLEKDIYDLVYWDDIPKSPEIQLWRKPTCTDENLMEIVRKTNGSLNDWNIHHLWQGMLDKFRIPHRISLEDI